MIEFLNTLPIWMIGLFIMILRMIDVPMGTLRTIAVVQGQLRLAALLGFFEVSIWVLAIAQVVSNISASPFLAFFYATGFALGNVIGITLEKRFSRGVLALRIITAGRANEITDAVCHESTVLASVPASGPNGPVSLVYLSLPARHVHEVIRKAQQVDPELFYILDRVRGWSSNLGPLPHPTGWRAVFKKK